MLKGPSRKTRRGIENNRVPAEESTAKAAVRNKLECNVCLELFKTPKFLPCYHTFCQKCLDDLATNSPTNGSFKCPTCRRDTAVPQDGVSAFQTNFYLTDELDAKRKERDTEHCVLHKDQELTFVCKKCHIRICPQCKATQHKQHNTILINEEIAFVKEDMKRIAAELGEHAGMVEKALSKLSTDENTEENKLQEAKKTVVEKADAWVAKIVESRDKALTLIEMVAAERQTDLEKKMLRLQRDQQKTKALLQQAELSALNDGVTTVLSAREIFTDEFSYFLRTSKAALRDNLLISSEPPSCSMNDELLKQFDAAVSSLCTQGLLKTSETNEPFLRTSLNFCGTFDSTNHCHTNEFGEPTLEWKHTTTKNENKFAAFRRSKERTQMDWSTRRRKNLTRERSPSPSTE